MTIYVTRTDTDAFYHLVTDEFHVLQQLRIQPRPCQSLVKDGGGEWRWISRDEAERILAAWELQAGPAEAVEPRQAA
jgi:hypothetical protein